MKKFAFLVFFLFNVMVFAESNDLYDVNYDAPLNILQYDTNQQFFQEIYLQYETAIKRSEDSIRNDEKKIRQNEVKSVKEEESQKYQSDIAEALEKQRKEIYENEIEAVRTNERELLSEEIRTAVTNELNEKFTLLYEEKKNKEIKELEKQLREQISLENENLKTKYKSEVETELIPKFEEKKNKEVKELESKLREQISLENEKLKTQFKSDVEKELAPKYEEKKNQEIETLKEQLALQVYNEQKENFDKELRSQISLENEVLAEKYKNEVRAELTSEFEEKKNEEIFEYKKEWKREVFEENHIRTERLKIVWPYILKIFLLITILILIYFITKIIRKIIAEKKTSNTKKREQKENLDYLTDTYLEKIKEYGGKTETIREEIDKSSKPEDVKKLHRKAIGIAQNTYKTLKSTPSITEYKKIFTDLDVSNIFANWNGAGDDEEMKQGLCNEFYSNINKYTETATEACYSKNNKKDIQNLLLTYTQTLKNTSEQVVNLAKQETNNVIKINLVTIAQKYGDLAKKFSEGDF